MFVNFVYFYTCAHPWTFAYANAMPIPVFIPIHTGRKIQLIHIRMRITLNKSHTTYHIRTHIPTPTLTPNHTHINTLTPHPHPNRHLYLQFRVHQYDTNTCTYTYSILKLPVCLWLPAILYRNSFNLAERIVLSSNTC